MLRVRGLGASGSTGSAGSTASAGATGSAGDSSGNRSEPALRLPDVDQAALPAQRSGHVDRDLVARSHGPAARWKRSLRPSEDEVSADESDRQDRGQQSGEDRETERQSGARGSRLIVEEVAIRDGDPERIEVEVARRFGVADRGGLVAQHPGELDRDRRGLVVGLQDRDRPPAARVGDERIDGVELGLLAFAVAVSVPGAHVEPADVGARDGHGRPGGRHLGGQVERLRAARRHGARVEVERVIQLDPGRSVQLAELGDVHAHVLGVANHTPVAVYR